MCGRRSVDATASAAPSGRSCRIQVPTKRSILSRLAARRPRKSGVVLRQMPRARPAVAEALAAGALPRLGDRRSLPSTPLREDGGRTRPRGPRQDACGRRTSRAPRAEPRGHSWVTARRRSGRSAPPRNVKTLSGGREIGRRARAPDSWPREDRGHGLRRGLVHRRRVRGTRSRSRARAAKYGNRTGSTRFRPHDATRRKLVEDDEDDRRSSWRRRRRRLRGRLEGSFAVGERTRKSARKMIGAGASTVRNVRTLGARA